MNPETCNHVFCYGSLRPDDDSGMPWTKDAVSGMRAQPATVPGARLYEDDYASLVFDDDNEINSSQPREDANKVVGWVLTADKNLFQMKLKQFDQIEGYQTDGPCLYQRAIADVCLGDPDKSIGGKPIGAEGTTVRAYVYHRPDCNKDQPIFSGDWLKRNTCTD